MPKQLLFGEFEGRHPGVKHPWVSLFSGNVQDPRKMLMPCHPHLFWQFVISPSFLYILVGLVGRLPA